MIESKSALLAVWLCLLVFACGAPFALLVSGARDSAPARIAPAMVRGAVLAISALLLAVRGVSGPSAPVVLAIAFVLPMLGAGVDALIGGLVALPLLATVAWWAPDITLGFPAALVFLLAGVCASALTRLPSGKSNGSLVATAAVLFALAVAAILPTGQLGTPTGFFTAWHHWGAYVSPAQAMLGGAVPFRDFPVQYGLGPTLLIAALSGGDAWVGAWRAVCMVNAFYLPAIGLCVALVLRSAPRGQRLLALATVACAVLFWSAFPADELGVMATPSVGGMRFLPLSLLLLSILAHEETKSSGATTGYALWLLGVAWSPEAAVYATVVWFPYLGFRAAQAREVETARDVILAALRGAGVAAIAILVGILALAVAFRAGFGGWPSFRGYITYILTPPGILQVRPFGPIWLALATLAVAGVALIGADPRRLRIGMVSILAFTAVLSYYLLGRSHDNNVLNLFPFMTLVAASALAAQPAPAFVGFVQIVLVGLVAWPATFGWKSWAETVERGEALTIGPARFLERVRFASPDAWALLDAQMVKSRDAPHASSADIGAALAWIAERGERAVLLNRSYVLPRQTVGADWTAMNNLANFAPLPRETIERYVRANADRTHLPGWLVVDRSLTPEWLPLDEWLRLFGTAYDITEERAFGGCTAYRLTSK